MALALAATRAGLMERRVRALQLAAARKVDASPQDDRRAQSEALNRPGITP